MKRGLRNTDNQNDESRKPAAAGEGAEAQGMSTKFLLFLLLLMLGLFWMSLQVVKELARPVLVPNVEVAP